VAKSFGGLRKSDNLSLEADPATQMSQELISDFIAGRRDTLTDSAILSYIRICKPEVLAAD
jgi:hypothetical protein